MALSRQSSFGSWPSNSSKVDVQSVNSGVESESNSLPSEATTGAMTSTHVTYNDIHIDHVSDASPSLMNEGNMNPEDAAQLHPNDVVITSEHRVKASPPNTANLLAQHQLPMLSQPENEDLKEKKAKAIAISSTVAPVQASDQKPSNLLVYNIATLLELGKGPSVTPRIMELCDSDIKENVLKDPLKQGHARLRGWSNDSDFASESMEAEEQIVFLSQAQRSQRKPIRQPYGPPQSSLAQQHAGFARFLREHASPPHHRVTAGGRIVPNGPLSPPPMFRLDSIDSIVQNHDLIAVTQSSHVPQPEMTSFFDTNSIEQPLAGSANSMLGQTDASSKQQGYAAPLGRAMNTSESSATDSKGQHQASVDRPTPSNAGGVLQLPPGAVPTIALPEGGLIVNYQGIMYRATLNQANNNTMLVPLQVICHAPEAQQQISSYPPANTYLTGSLGFQPLTVLPSSSMLAHSMPLVSSTNGAHLFQHHQMQTQAQIQALQNQYDSLHSQLEGLDRHVALYRHMLAPMVNASMVAQRIQLVQQLDNIRVSKDQLERSISTASQDPGCLQPAHMPQGSQAAFEQYGRQIFQIPAGTQSYTPMLNVGNHMMGVAAPVTIQVPQGRLGHEMGTSSKNLNKTTATQAGLKNGKYLSPDAPAFVPNNTSASAFSSGGRTQGQGDEQKRSTAATQQVANTATPKVTPPAQERVLVVTQDDVEYADRFGLNDEPGPKLYCSTIEDFQEVIRRAREQARLYGCAGGQSKDPEHDAEEDIRWAMSDKDAIPLPTTVPDHVANPRPWKWADSAFNIRADEAAYFANPVRLKHGANGESSSKYANTGWGQNKIETRDALTILTRQDSWDSLPGAAPCNHAPIDYSNWGKLPSDLDAGPAVGSTSAWGKIGPTQAKYNGGAPTSISNVNTNHPAFSTMGHGNKSEESCKKGWSTSVRSNLWPNAENHQDDYVDDGWNTPPPSIFTATITNGTWAQKIPSLNQSQVSHTATDKSHLSSEVSRVAKGLSGESTGSHAYAKKNTVSFSDTRKLQRSQPLCSIHEESNHKPYQAYVEDAVDSPTGKVSYWDIVAARPSLLAKKGKAWYKANDKDDDDSESIDSWDTNRSECENAASQPLPECILEINQIDGHDQGKAFEPNEVKAVRIPSPARNAETNPYYLNMIKDPRYSVSTGDIALAGDGVGHRGTGSGKPATKENQNVQSQINAAVRGEDKIKQARPSNVASSVGMWQNHQVHKAPSSIAAPVYQAHGYLPQYDGAANSLHWGESTVGPHRRPPSRALHGGGVSVAGPPIGRLEHFPTGHYDAGNHFFRNLREQQREDMARHKPLNPPNWQG